MNVVREITRINQTELDIAINNPSASWHQQYSDSAYIFIGGLPYDLTEGDVITIFSQYGEVIDVNLPRANPNSGDKSNGPEKDAASTSQQQPKPAGKGKHRGFGFLMYEDQRSTVLAVDNLNGAQVLGRTLRVDHVAAYKQPKVTDEEGNRVDAEVKNFNAAPPEMGLADDAVDEDGDLEDPMAAYFQQRRREEKGKFSLSDEQEKEEKRRRKEQRARIRAEREDRRKRSSHSYRDDRRHRSGSHRDDDRDDDKDRRRHRSRRHERDSASEEEGVNRYEQMKESRSVLDSNGSTSRTRPRSRSRTPPSRSSRHRTERSSRDEEARRDDKASHRRREERDSTRRDPPRSGESRRRSRSP